jgi:hypothetical protein
MDLFAWLLRLCLLRERIALERDQEAGAKGLHFPGNIRAFLSPTTLSKRNAIGFPRIKCLYCHLGGLPHFFLVGYRLPIILFILSEIVFGGIEPSFPLRMRTQVHLCHTKEKFIRIEDGPKDNENIHITAGSK